MAVDAGSHSHTCATAESGTCHCDCHGRQHGMIHVPKAKRGNIATKKLPGGGYQVTRSDTGLPPGGGTKQERRDAHGTKVAVKSTGKAAPKGGKSVLSDGELSQLDAAVSKLATGSPTRGRAPQEIGKDLAKAVREGDLADVEKFGEELQRKLTADAIPPARRRNWSDIVDEVKKRHGADGDDKPTDGAPTAEKANDKTDKAGDPDNAPTAEKITVKTNKPVLSDRQLAELDRQVAALPGETNSNRGGRTPRVVGQEYAKAVRDGADLATIEKLGHELHGKTQVETNGRQRDDWGRALDMVHRKTEERDTGVKPLQKGSVLNGGEHAELSVGQFKNLADDDGRVGAVDPNDRLSTRSIAQLWQQAVQDDDKGGIDKYGALLSKRLQSTVVADNKTRKNLQHAIGAVNTRRDAREFARNIRGHNKREEFPAFKSITPEEVHALSLHKPEGFSDRPEDVNNRLQHLRKTGEVLPPAREAKAKEAIADKAKATEAAGRKGLLNDEEQYRLQRQVAGLTGTTRRGGRSPQEIGQDLANAAAEGDAAKANKLADELTSTLMNHRASDRTLTMWRNTLKPVRDQKPKAEPVNLGPKQTPMGRLLARTNGPDRDSDLFVRAASGVDKAEFDKLSPEMRKPVLDKLERLGRGTGLTARDARSEHQRLLTGEGYKPGLETVPTHIQEALKAVENNHRSAGLPTSMMYARLNKKSFEDHFTPQQRASILAKMRDIRSGMKDDAPDRPGVDRVIGDLEAIDGAKPAAKVAKADTTAKLAGSTPRQAQEAATKLGDARTRDILGGDDLSNASPEQLAMLVRAANADGAAEKPATPKPPRQPKMRNGEEVRWHGKTDSEVAAEDARKAEQAKTDAVKAQVGEVERGTPQPLSDAEARSRASDHRSYTQALLYNKGLAEEFKKAGIDITPEQRDRLKPVFEEYLTKARDAAAEGAKNDQLRDRLFSLREGKAAYPDRANLYDPAEKQALADLMDSRDKHSEAVIAAHKAATGLQTAIAGVYKEHGKRKTPSAVKVPMPSENTPGIDRSDNRLAQADADIKRALDRAPVADRPEVKASVQKYRQLAHELDKANKHAEVTRRASSSAAYDVQRLEGSNTHVPEGHPDRQKWIAARAEAGKRGAEAERAQQALSKARRAYNEQIGGFVEDVRRAGQSHEAEQAAQKVKQERARQDLIAKSDAARKVKNDQIKNTAGVAKDADRPNLEILTEGAEKAMGGRTPKDYLDDLGIAYAGGVVDNPDVKRARAKFNRSIYGGRPTVAAISNLQQTMQRVAKVQEQEAAAQAFKDQRIPHEVKMEAVTNPATAEKVHNYLTAVRDLSAARNGGAARGSRLGLDPRDVVDAREMARQQLHDKIDRHLEDLRRPTSSSDETQRSYRDALHQRARQGDAQALIGLLPGRPQNESAVRRLVDSTTEPIPAETPGALRQHAEAVRNAKVAMNTHDLMRTAHSNRAANGGKGLGSELMNSLTPAQHEAMRQDSLNSWAEHDKHNQAYEQARTTYDQAVEAQAKAKRDYEAAGVKSRQDLVAHIKGEMANLPVEPKSDLAKREAKAAGVPRTITKLTGREKELARSVNQAADALDEAETKAAEFRRQATAVKKTHRDLSGGKLHPEAQDALDVMFDRATEGTSAVYQREHLDDALARWRQHQAEKDA